jgi:hypothetical protein
MCEKSCPILPHELILEHIFPFFQMEEIGLKVLMAVHERSISDLYFMVGRNKDLVPGFISRNEEYTLQAGHSIMLPVMNKLGFKMSKCLFEQAARRGNFEMLKWLWKKTDCPWHEQTFAAAAEHGNLDICKWLKRKRCPWDLSTFFNAAGGGNRRLLEWLKLNGCPWNVQTYDLAVRKGDLETIRWLKENGCPWNEHLFMSAAYYEKLEIMRWLFENKCPWDERTYHFALDSGNVEVLSWLRMHKCPGTSVDEVDETQYISMFIQE